MTDLYVKYKSELSADDSSLDYAVAFVKSFRTLKPEFLEGTIWEDLWTIAPMLSDLELTKRVVELSESLSADNSLYCKYTTGVAYDVD